jgi:hypothetical protein
MLIKINNATRLNSENYTIPKDIVFKDCMLSVYSKLWQVKYNLQENNIESPSQTALLIQIHKTYEVWEFENTFGLGSHCEGFVPGMIVAFKPNNETGIILDYKYTY